MITFNQIALHHGRRRSPKILAWGSLSYYVCPQKKDLYCQASNYVNLKNQIQTIRRIAKVHLSYHRRVIAYVPGQGHPLIPYSECSNTRW